MVEVTQQERLLAAKEVAYIGGIGVSTVWSLTKQGKLPQPVKISTQITRWKKSDIDAWLENPAAWEAK